jgi:tetratricopeptide (TPR) repeat protein
MLSKEGFRDTNVWLTLYANEKRTVAVHLISATYADAVDNARYYSTGSSPDFERALDEVNKALQIKPGDEDALKLKQVIEFKRHLYQAKVFEREKSYNNALAEIDAALKFDPTDTEALTLKTSLQAAMERAEQAAVEARRKPEGSSSDSRLPSRFSDEIMRSAKGNCRGPSMTANRRNHIRLGTNE